MPIDPCGLAVDLATGQGFVTMAFYRDSPKRQRVAVYQVPRERAWVPGLKTFLLSGMRDKRISYEIPPGGVGDDDYSFSPRWGWVPPFDKVGNHYCGTPEQWRYGAGPDDPSLEWGLLGFSSCCEGVLPVGTENQIAKFGPGGLSVVDSRVRDTGAGPVDVDAALRVLGQLILNGGPVNGDLFDVSVVHVAGSSVATFTLDRLDAGVKRLRLILSRGDVTSGFNFVDPDGATVPGIMLNGDAAATIGIDGWDVRSGLVFGVPSSGDLVTFLGLGSAAFVGVAAFDSAGTAAAAVAAHVALADPHAQYLLETDAAASYQPLGGTDVRAYLTANQALTQSASNPITGWTEGTDALGEFDPTTGVFSPSESGTYYVEFRALQGGTVTRTVALIADTSPATVRRLSDGPALLAGGVTRLELSAGTDYTFDLYPLDAGISAQGGAANTWLVIRRAY